MHQHIIRRHTHLSCIRKFGDGNASGCHFNIRIAFHHTGAFTPQFQSNRHQSFGRHFVNNLANSCAARKKNMIKRKVVHHSRYQRLALSLYTKNIFRRESVFNDAFYHCGCCRSQFTGLYHRTITCCYSTDKRVNK